MAECEKRLMPDARREAGRARFQRAVFGIVPNAMLPSRTQRLPRKKKHFGRMPNAPAAVSAPRTAGRRLPQKQKRAQAPAFAKSYLREKSADLRPQETTVIFDTNAAATEKVGYCRDCFAAAFGAGTDGEDEIAEGKLLGLAEDLRVLFHICPW
jgi:hypothetical protein